MEDGSMSLEDAIRFKYDIGRSIRFGGKTVKEIEALRELSAEDYKGVRKNFDEYMKSARILSPIAISIASICGAALLFFHGWLRGLGAGLLVISFWTAIKWQEYREGFLHGYRDGVFDGVARALGLSEKDREEIAKLSVDLAVDEILVNRLDAKGKTT